MKALSVLLLVAIGVFGLVIWKLKTKESSTPVVVEKMVDRIVEKIVVEKQPFKVIIRDGHIVNFGD